MIYRFKLKFEEDEDFTCLVDVDTKQSFYHLHDIAQEAIGFNKKEEASFFTSNDNWKPLKEIAIPQDYAAKIQAAEPLPGISKHIIDPYQKFIYLADKKHEWVLEVELVKITDAEKGKSYPSIFRKEGFAPRQFIVQPTGNDDVADTPELPEPQKADLGTEQPSANKTGNADESSVSLDDFPDLGDIEDLDFSDEL